MPKVYLEYDDRHNPPSILTFENEDAALDRVFDSEGGDRKAIWDELFDPDNEDSFGELDGIYAKWTLITEEEARYRSEYWDRVAEAIRADQVAPHH